MSGDVVYLKYRSPEERDDMMAFSACRNCSNKTFTHTIDRVDYYPLVRCAACGAHIGRLGWVCDPVNKRPIDEVEAEQPKGGDNVKEGRFQSRRTEGEAAPGNGHSAGREDRQGPPGNGGPVEEPGDCA